MKWVSTNTDARQFCASVSKDPDLVFVSGIVDGRRCALSVSTAIETDAEMYVVSTHPQWVVTVRREGWRIRAKKMNIRTKK